jgi:prevent-host-death family protein
MSSITSRQFNQDVSAAKRAATSEPVIITDRGRPSHVLLSIDQYRRLVADQRSIVEWLSVDDDLDVHPDRVELSLSEPDL